MRDVDARERSHGELAFGVLKMLMTGYRLWGVDSVVGLGDLRALLGASHPRLQHVARFLVDEGLVDFDSGAETVRLTADGAENLLTEQA